jgi:hypothetical protein
MLCGVKPHRRHPPHETEIPSTHSYKMTNTLSRILTSCCMCILVLLESHSVSASDVMPNAPSTSRFSSLTSIPGRPFEGDDEDLFPSQVSEEKLFPVQLQGWKTAGLGREFDLFDTRGGQDGGRDDDPPPRPHNGNDDVPGTTRLGARSKLSTIAPASQRQFVPLTPSGRSSSSTSFFLSSGERGGATGSSSSNANRYSSKSTSKSTVFQSAQGWWNLNIAPTVKNWPRIQCRVEPTTTLKIRKTFRPLKTVVRLGADFNTQLGVWQFKSSWEDAIIGGKITLAGKELQLSKSWQLSVGKNLVYLDVLVSLLLNGTQRRANSIESQVRWKT